MTARQYRLGRRREAADETRARIITAVREILAADDGAPGFTMDAVARRAGVARMTIYLQFGSKQGLLEALFDSLAASGGMGHLSEAFMRPDPLEALDALVATFAHFWAADRVVKRRLHGLAALDPEFAPVWEARVNRRREALTVLVGRLAKQRGGLRPAAREETIDVLFALTGFATYDALAEGDRGPVEVAGIVQRLVRAVVGWAGR